MNSDGGRDMPRILKLEERNLWFERETADLSEENAPQQVGVSRLTESNSHLIATNKELTKTHNQTLTDLRRRKDKLRLAVVQRPRAAPFPLDGIIARLTEERGGNAHDHDDGLVTAKSVLCRRHATKSALDLASNSDFASANAEDQCMCDDFKGRRAIPICHSLKPSK
jgi:hypothetical protein